MVTGARLPGALVTRQFRPQNGGTSTTETTLMSGKPEDAGANQPANGSGPTSQEFQHSQVSARVPEKVGRGVFSTGVLVLQTGTEFLLDFVQGMVQPRQVAARVVMAPSFIPN